MNELSVRNGNRTLRFSGDPLAFSSSKRAGSPRWIEFALFKTDKGDYVLSRVGVSHVYHSSTCPLVTRYGLHEAHVDALTVDSVPCEECKPYFADPIIYPETHRYWTLVTEEPGAILDALYKTDKNNTRYLTRVAEQLLEKASEVDPAIDQVYRVEYI